MLNRITISELSTILFATSPYIGLIFMLLPITIFGFSFYFAITSIVFLMLFIQIMLGKFRVIDASGKLIVVSLLTFSLFLTTHLLIIDDFLFKGLTYFAKELMSSRIAVTPILYLLVALAIIKTAGRDIVSKIIVINAFIQSIIGIIHHHFIPHLITGHPSLHPGQLYIYIEGLGPFREPGILISASLYANIILLGIFIIGFNLIRKLDYGSIIMGIFMLYGLSLSGSRLPSIVAFIFLIVILIRVVYNFYNKNNLKKILFSALFVVILFIFMYLFIFPEINSMSMRFTNEGLGVRNIKNNLALSIIFENFQNFYFGTKTSYINSIASPEGVGISDNSYLAIWLKFGIIYLSLLFIVMSLLIFSRVKLSFGVIILVGYFMTNLFLTNSIYWDLYLLYFFATLFVINDMAITNIDNKKPKYAYFRKLL